MTTYAEFKQKFESRYWNSHTQRLLRNELEYGRYDRKLGITPENYIIQQVERAKHLTPAFSDIDIVTKLAYHFNHNIRVAVFTPVSYTHLDVYKRQHLKTLRGQHA